MSFKGICKKRGEKMKVNKATTFTDTTEERRRTEQYKLVKGQKETQGKEFVKVLEDMKKYYKYEVE